MLNLVTNLVCRVNFFFFKTQQNMHLKNSSTQLMFSFILQDVFHVNLCICLKSKFKNRSRGEKRNNLIVCNNKK